MLRRRSDGQADLVLSDMAPNTTGHNATDHLRIMALAELALDFACRVLAPGGGFVAKVFQGGTEKDFLATAEASVSPRSATPSRRPAARTAPSSTWWRPASRRSPASGRRNRVWESAGPFERHPITRSALS